MTHFRHSVFCILNVLVNSHKDHWSLFVFSSTFFLGGNEKTAHLSGAKKLLVVGRVTSWWFQPIKNMLVKSDLPRDRGENKNMGNHHLGFQVADLDVPLEVRING